jgi:hypothetical protein
MEWGVDAARTMRFKIEVEGGTFSQKEAKLLVSELERAIPLPVEIDLTSRLDEKRLSIRTRDRRRLSDLA